MMQKKTRDILSILGTECVVALLIGGAIFVLITKLNTGEHLVSNRYGANIPVAGAIAILSILGVALLAYLPGTLWKDKNMPKADRKRHEKQARKKTKQPRKPTSSMHFPWE